MQLFILMVYKDFQDTEHKLTSNSFCSRML